MINENLKNELSNAKDKNGCIEWKGNIRLAFLLVSTLRSSDLTIRQFSDLYSIDAGIVGRLNEGLSAQGMYWQQLSDAIAQLPTFIRRRKIEPVKYDIDFSSFVFEESSFLVELNSIRQKNGRIIWSKNFRIIVFTVAMFRKSKLTYPVFANKFQIPMETLYNFNKGKTSNGRQWDELATALLKLDTGS